MANDPPFDLIARRPNFYGFSGLDRAAPLRDRDGWLDGLLRAPETRIVPVWRNRSLIREVAGEAPRAGFPTIADHAGMLDRARAVTMLGSSDGTAYVAADISDLPAAEAGGLLSGFGDFTDLRDVGPLMERFEGAVLAYARGICYWHGRHRFCGVCGAPTIHVRGGHQRNCTNEQCRAPHFPRTDPAVIMLVHHGPRALLGRQRVWLAGMYSTLAGFLEPGETLEEAVAREVHEETNITVRDVRYHSSQPWPFPCSLMLGFHAEAKTVEVNRNDMELEDAQWFHVDQLRDFRAHGKRLPRRDSIARRLIEDWIATQD